MQLRDGREVPRERVIPEGWLPGECGLGPTMCVCESKGAYHIYRGRKRYSLSPSLGGRCGAMVAQRIDLKARRTGRCARAGRPVDLLPKPHVPLSRTCDWCGRRYTPYARTSRYCEPACRAAGWRARRQQSRGPGPATRRVHLRWLRCSWCGGDYQARAGQRPTGGYCKPAHRQAAYRARQHDPSLASARAIARGHPPERNPASTSPRLFDVMTGTLADLARRSAPLC